MSGADYEIGTGAYLKRLRQFVDEHRVRRRHSREGWPNYGEYVKWREHRDAMIVQLAKTHDVHQIARVYQLNHRRVRAILRKRGGR